MIRIIGRETRTFSAEKTAAISDIARQNDLSEERYVAILNGKPTTWDRVAAVEDDLVFLEVFSGG